MKNLFTRLTEQVPFDQDDPNPLVLYHGGCPDGFAAAVAAWDRFEGRGEYVAMAHKSGGVPPPDATGRNVFVLDYAFDPEPMAELAAQAKSLVLLDHHRRMAEKLANFECPCGILHFDTTKSGARLAWEFFQPDRPVPLLVRAVEDRDLWAWKTPDLTGAFTAKLDTEPFDFARWSAIAKMEGPELDAYIAEGAPMDRKFLDLAYKMLDEARPLEINGVTGLMVNAPNVFHSNVGGALADRSGTFGAVWCFQDGLVKVGLRSRSEFSLIPIAESQNGGGHDQAAAFTLPIDRLPEMLSGVLEPAPAPTRRPRP